MVDDVRYMFDGTVKNMGEQQRAQASVATLEKQCWWWRCTRPSYTGLPILPTRWSVTSSATSPLSSSTPRPPPSLLPEWYQHGQGRDGRVKLHGWVARDGSLAFTSEKIVRQPCFSSSGPPSRWSSTNPLHKLNLDTCFFHVLITIMGREHRVHIFFKISWWASHPMHKVKAILRRNRGETTMLSFRSTCMQDFRASGESAAMLTGRISVPRLEYSVERLH